MDEAFSSEGEVEFGAAYAPCCCTYPILEKHFPGGGLHPFTLNSSEGLQGLCGSPHMSIWLCRSVWLTPPRGWTDGVHYYKAKVLWNMLDCLDSGKMSRTTFQNNSLENVSNMIIHKNYQKFILCSSCLGHLWSCELLSVITHPWESSLCSSELPPGACASLATQFLEWKPLGVFC